MKLFVYDSIGGRVPKCLGLTDQLSVQLSVLCGLVVSSVSVILVVNARHAQLG
jgi:hypothetical protein